MTKRQIVNMETGANTVNTDWKHHKSKTGSQIPTASQKLTNNSVIKTRTMVFKHKPLDNIMKADGNLHN